MAFNTSAQDPKPLEVIGSYLPAACGIVANGGGGTVDVIVTCLKTVRGVILTSQSASTVVPYVSATSGNTFTITADANEVINWVAWGDSIV